MGVYDTVRFETRRPVCGTNIGREHWQTKDSACSMGEIGINETHNFYSGCPSCSAWIEFTRDRGPDGRQMEPARLDDALVLGYKMTVASRR